MVKFSREFKRKEAPQEILEAPEQNKAAPQQKKEENYIDVDALCQEKH